MSMFFRVLMLLGFVVTALVVGPAVWSAPGEPVTAANADPAWFKGRTKPSMPSEDAKLRGDSYWSAKYVEPGDYWYKPDNLEGLPDVPVASDAADLAKWQAAVSAGKADQETGFRLALAHARAHNFKCPDQGAQRCVSGDDAAGCDLRAVGAG
jgi:hypothetical protein